MNRLIFLVDTHDVKITFRHPPHVTLTTEFNVKNYDSNLIRNYIKDCQRVTSGKIIKRVLTKKYEIFFVDIPKYTEIYEFYKNKLDFLLRTEKLHITSNIESTTDTTQKIRNINEKFKILSVKSI